MEDKILVNLSKDHTFESATDIIGREGEGNTTRFEITIPEKLIGCSVYLDFEIPNGDKLRTPKLKIENGVAIYDVVAYLLADDGEIKVQAVLITESGQTWKSSIKTYFNQNSINALEEIPEKEDFFAELIQRILGEITDDMTEAVNAEKNRAVAKEAELASNDTKIAKRVTNLETAVYGDLAQETGDNTVAFVKDVPEDALPFAAVNTLGGMTRKCTNLVNIRDWLNPDYGAINADGSLTFTTVGGANLVKLYTGAFPSGKYTISNMSGLMLYVQLAQGDYSNPVAVGASKSFTYDGTSYLRFIYVDQGANTTVTYKVMLNSGDTALPYEPFFEGLRSAPTEAVESVGANLIPFPYNTLTINADGVKGSIDEAQRLIINGTATRTTEHLLAKITLPMGNYCLTTNQSNENTRIYLRKNGGFITSRAKGDSPYIFAVESNTDVYSITAVMLLDGVFSNDIIVPMLNKGTTAQPYRPYTRNTLPIPEAVQALDGYGEGVNESVYNYIDYEKKQFGKRVKKVVFDGSENWARYSDSDSIRGVGYCYALRITNKKVKGMSNCSHFNRVTMAWDFGKIGDYCDGNSDLNVYFVTSETTVEEWKSRLAANPITLVYELATPEVTDISDILPADNYIGVEGGGTLTFKNESGFAVPSEITYIMKGAESE